ncbi:TRAP transporter large permease [Mameliella sediminis]|uniref:TRAP transporter large permease n=1 Tax=Mameliella sediminis TaxID=2836866 RepID=UPI001C4978FF|nr:TRAP transporter large permease [Mameliella sediminis]MBV7395933.1 TRAP transporter large permease [Mameliella sediminis]
MSGTAAAGTGFFFLFVLIGLRVPIALSMALVGAVGFIAFTSFDAQMAMMNAQAYWRFTTYDLSVVPLFILMGQLATKAGLSQELFTAARAWTGHRRGGLAMAAIAGCAGFGAICGSSLATAATMGKVALPELRRYNYNGALATGALAAGGTLGILIPPSIILVIYAIIVEVNIVTMFQAAFLPGILAAVGYILAVSIYVRIFPEAGPAAPRMTYAERFAALRAIWPVLFIFCLVIGGIYFGIFTPTEAAAVGAFLTGLFAWARGSLRWPDLREAVLGTIGTTAAIFMILLGAEMLNGFLALTQVTFMLADWFASSGFSPIMVLTMMLLLFIVMGCVMDSLSMILLTIPIFWPILSGMDFGMDQTELKIWFGIIALIVVEMGLITPPVGMNVFIINQMARDVPIRETFKGVIPFMASDILRVVLLVSVPWITLSVPRLLG